MNKAIDLWRFDLFKALIALLLLAVLLFSVFNRDRQPGSNGIEDAAIATFTAVPHAPPAEQPTATGPGIPAPPPPSPAADVPLVPDEDGQILRLEGGDPVYVLDPGDEQWKPVIPDGLRSSLPDGFQLLHDPPAGWSIVDGSGQVMYTWDQGSVVWIASQLEGAKPTGECPTVLPPRLLLGEHARAQFNLNLRTSPGVKDNWVLTNIARTELKVVGGPVCVEQEGGAYWWWEVENPSGVRGWSAEAHQAGLYYFLEPVQR